MTDIPSEEDEEDYGPRLPIPPRTPVFGLPRFEPWEHQAMCVGQEHYWHSAAADDRAIALELCGLCPVRVECLKLAHQVDTILGVTTGIWGGTTASQRKAQRASLDAQGRVVSKTKRRPTIGRSVTRDELRANAACDDAAT